MVVESLIEDFNEIISNSNSTLIIKNFKNIAENIIKLEQKDFFEKFGQYNKRKSIIKNILKSLEDIIEYGGEFIYLNLNSIENDLFDTDKIIEEINKRNKNDQLDKDVLKNFGNEFALVLFYQANKLEEDSCVILEINIKFKVFLNSFNSNLILNEIQEKEFLKVVDEYNYSYASDVTINSFFESSFSELYKRWTGMESLSSERMMTEEKYLSNRENLDIMKLKIINCKKDLDKNIYNGKIIQIGPKNKIYTFGRKKSKTKNNNFFDFNSEDRYISYRQFEIRKMNSNFFLRDLSKINPTACLVRNKSYNLFKGIIILLAETEMIYVKRIQFNYGNNIENGISDVNFSKFELTKSSIHDRFLNNKGINEKNEKMNKKAKKHLKNYDYLILKGLCGEYEGKEKEFKVNIENRETSKQIFKIGKSNNCDMKFNVDSIDDYHVEIAYDKQLGWTICENFKDINSYSKNGTFLCLKTKKQYEENKNLPSAPLKIKDGYIICADKNYFEVILEEKSNYLYSNNSEYIPDEDPYNLLINQQRKKRDIIEEEKLHLSFENNEIDNVEEYEEEEKFNVKDNFLDFEFKNKREKKEDDDLREFLKSEKNENKEFEDMFKFNKKDDLPDFEFKNKREKKEEDELREFLKSDTNENKEFEDMFKRLNL